MIFESTILIPSFSCSIPHHNPTTLPSLLNYSPLLCNYIYFACRLMLTCESDGHGKCLSRKKERKIQSKVNFKSANYPLWTLRLLLPHSLFPISMLFLESQLISIAHLHRVLKKIVHTTLHHVSACCVVIAIENGAEAIIYHLVDLGHHLLHIIIYVGGKAMAMNFCCEVELL